MVAASDSTVQPFDTLDRDTSYHFPSPSDTVETTQPSYPTTSNPRSPSINPPSPSFLNTPPEHQSSFHTFYIGTSSKSQIEHPEYYESERLFPLHINDIVSEYDCSSPKDVGLEEGLRGKKTEYVILDKLKTMEGSMVWLAGRKDEEGKFREDADGLVTVHVRPGYEGCDDRFENTGDLDKERCSEEQKVWERLMVKNVENGDEGKRFVDMPLEGFVKQGPNGLNYFTIHELAGCDLGNGNFYSICLRRWLGKGLNAVRLAQDVAKGVAWLHSKGVVHGDLSLPNILLVPDRLTGWPTQTVDIAYGHKHRLCSHSVHRFDGSAPGPTVPRYILCDDHQLQQAFIHTLSRTVGPPGVTSPPAPQGTAFAKISNLTYAFLLPTPTLLNPNPNPAPRVIPRTIGYRSLDYAPPEVLLNQPEKIGPASDVWALGCVVFKLVTGQELFGDVDEEERLGIMCRHCFVFGREYGMEFFRRWFSEEEVDIDGNPGSSIEDRKEEYALPIPLFSLHGLGGETASPTYPNSYAPSAESTETLETSHSASSTPTPAPGVEHISPNSNPFSFKFPLLSPLAPPPPLDIVAAKPEAERRINPTFLLKQEIKRSLQRQELVTFEDMVLSSKGVRLGELGVERVMTLLGGCFRLEPGDRIEAEDVVKGLEELLAEWK